MNRRSNDASLPKTMFSTGESAAMCPPSEQTLCTQCPRACGVDRETQKGVCLSGRTVRVARASLHLWEEPCLSYGNGSGTVFFSGCPLKCVYCQNHEISAQSCGKEQSANELAAVFLGLQEKGAVNINLVNPTHFSLQILESLKLVKSYLHIPVVYNSGGYDKVETLRQLSGFIDLYLPDFKYESSVLSANYSAAPDYFEVVKGAIAEMHRQCGYAEFDEDGHMQKGVLIRHLVLPNHRDDSKRVLEYLAQNYDVTKLTLSLMRQYFPTHKAREYKELSRKLTSLEYDDVVNYASALGFVNGFIQTKESASENYVPDFDF